MEPVFNHTVKSYAADPFVRVTPSDGVSFLKKISELMTKSGKLTVQLSG